jgi:hypothetical protein
MRIHSARSVSRFAAGALALVVAASCLRDQQGGAAAGTVDTASPAASAITAATGPGAQVTRTDGASVRTATQFKLTDENFNKFLRAADSLAALQNLDAGVRGHLAQPLADAGSTDADAGLRWLESNAAVSGAIESAGLSVRDYFVMAIAIASAEQTRPSAAPPTPVAKDNAEFVRRRSADVARLHTLESGKPKIVITP